MIIKDLKTWANKGAAPNSRPAFPLRFIVVFHHFLSAPRRRSAAAGELDSLGHCTNIHTKGKSMITTYRISTSFALAAIIFSGCSTGDHPQQRHVQSVPASKAPAAPTKQPTRERFTVDIVTGDKSQMKAAQLPGSGQYFGSQSQYVPGPSGPQKFTSMMVVGRYIVQVEPAARKPLRLTLFGLSEPLTWSIDDSSIAEISASGREAFLDFKTDGKMKVLVRSGENIVFRLGANANTVNGEKGKVWQVLIARQNEEGKNIDEYGEVSSK